MKNRAFARLDEHRKGFSQQSVEGLPQQFFGGPVCILDYTARVSDEVGCRRQLEQFLEILERSALLSHCPAKLMVRPMKTVRPTAGSKNFPRAALTLNEGE